MAVQAVALAGAKAAAKLAVRKSVQIASRIAARAAVRSAAAAARAAARSAARAGLRAIKMGARSVKQRGLGGAIKHAGTRALQNSPRAQKLFSGAQKVVQKTSKGLDKLAQLATVSSATIMALKLSGQLTPEQEKELEEMNNKIQKTNNDAQKINNNLKATDEAMTGATTTT